MKKAKQPSHYLPITSFNYYVVILSYIHCHTNFDSKAQLL